MSENRTSGLENRTKKRPVFGMSGYRTSGCYQSVRLSDRLNAPGRPITRHKRPVIGHCLKAGQITNRTLFENAEIRTLKFWKYARPFIRIYIFCYIENGLG